jgi:hypothetical protein
MENAPFGRRAEPPGAHFTVATSAAIVVVAIAFGLGSGTLLDRAGVVEVMPRPASIAVPAIDIPPARVVPAVVVAGGSFPSVRAAPPTTPEPPPTTRPVATADAFWIATVTNQTLNQNARPTQRPAARSGFRAAEPTATPRPGHIAAPPPRIDLAASLASARAARADASRSALGSVGTTSVGNAE